MSKTVNRQPGVQIAPGYKLYHIVSDFSHIIAPITVPFKCDTTFRDIKNEVARVLNIEQQRVSTALNAAATLRMCGLSGQELYYAGIPMGDDWNVLDLPIDCDTFHVRVLPKKTAQEEYGELSEQDKLIDGEELPAMIRHQMELERLGRWSLSASQRGDNEQAETTQDNHADAMMQTAYIESEYAIMHDRIVAQVNPYPFTHYSDSLLAAPCKMVRASDPCSKGCSSTEDTNM